MLIMENFQLHSNVSEISNELDLMLHVHQIWDVVVKKQWYCIIYIYPHIDLLPTHDWCGHIYMDTLTYLID